MSDEEAVEEPIHLEEIPSDRGFYIGLYFEYSWNASFLYNQRLYFLDDFETTWVEAIDLEERFEPQIDGLFLGSELARDVCLQQIDWGDPGEHQAAIRVFCRHQWKELIWNDLEKLDVNDDEMIHAVSDALNREMPESWEEELIQKGVESESPAVVSLTIRLMGWRRLSIGAVFLLDQLKQQDNDRRPEIVKSMSQFVEKTEAKAFLTIDVRKALFEILGGDHHESSYFAALTLLHGGYPSIMSLLLAYVSGNPRLLITLGLSGNQDTFARLLATVNPDQNALELLTAFWLLGDIRIVSILLHQLINEELADSAALALNQITGADLYVETFVPDEIDEAMLYEEELEALKNGELIYEPGKEPGSYMIKLTTDPEIWEKWWEDHQGEFDEKLRYRNGKPYSPFELLNNLKSERSPREVRDLAYEELVIRYSCEIPFDTEMTVKEQYMVLKDLSEFTEEINEQFKPGKYYLNGTSIDTGSIPN